MIIPDIIRAAVVKKTTSAHLGLSLMIQDNELVVRYVRKSRQSGARLPSLIFDLSSCHSLLIIMHTATLVPKVLS